MPHASRLLQTLVKLARETGKLKVSTCLLSYLLRKQFNLNYQSLNPGKD